MNVLTLTGSLRTDSTNRRLAQVAIDRLPQEATGSEFTGLADLPHYCEDLDGAEVPAAAADLRAAVAAADALIVVTPEYNGLLSGVLKNAIDWVSRPRGEAAIAGKPVVVLGASGSPRAAQWARESAVRALSVAGAKPLERTFGLPSAHQAFDQGGLVDPDHRAGLDAVLRELIGQLVSC